MRDTFVKTLIELAKKDKNIELVTGDLGFGVLKPYWEQLPEQFINAGIAEQNMTTMAAGMALEGKTVFTYSIGNFPTIRCLEQIRNDCAYHNANVKIVCVGGSFRKRTKSFIGSQAVNQLETLYANKAFVSCTAVNRKFGVTDDSEREAEIRRKMIANSEETFLIVDRTKFDNLESHLICRLDKIDYIITDQKLSNEWEESLKKLKVDIVYI